MNRFLERYKKLGQDIDPNEIKIKPSLRVNTLKINESDLIRRLKNKKVRLEKIPFLENGYWYESAFSLGSTPEYLQGYYYLQEAASQLPAQALSPAKDDVVLDCCAAPGSKTTQLAQIMDNEGMIIALDNNKKRLESLKNNVERMGVKNAMIYQIDAKMVKSLGMIFDKILVDAPCSGNFAIDKDWLTKRDMAGIKNNAMKQKSIISICINILKPDGILVYSTCSLEPEEDEQIIEYALNNFDVKLEKLDLDIGDPGITSKTKLCKRLWPNKTGTQGFFIAKLRKN
ncbi:MAG: RsmB/NOP family class I SAM-dependent RNA methyltransferase [Nanoarchaeota archaeon]|nr:RsmB/NOP family class I SAM-dependent RNA methyltransferase [Nanoarchaeota archaeon]